MTCAGGVLLHVEMLCCMWRFSAAGVDVMLQVEM